MINLFNASIETLSLHKVGNKSRDEKLFLSDEPYKLSDDISILLKEFFLKPFREKEENYYRFAHDVHLDYHDVYNLIKNMFQNPDESHFFSGQIAKLLFECSNHPHIKSGELYVAYLRNVSIDNVNTDAIGIFKSEIKADYIEVNEAETKLEIALRQGISLDKLDKGAIIFNVEAENGYKILTIDSNRYDARYWLEHFLSVDIFEDEHFHTKKYLKFVQDFAKEVVNPAEDKREEVMFMNRSVNFFAKNDEFEETKFLNDVMDNPDLIPEFKNFKVEKGPKYSIEDVSSFPISNSAVTDARKKIKSLIKLDTGVEIKVSITNPEIFNQVIEKGWDEEKQQYYYLIYFNKEEK